MKANYEKYVLNFKRPAGTSRGVLNQKETYFLYLEEEDGKTFTGECALFRGLSAEDIPEYEQILQRVCEALSKGESIRFDDLRRVPSIQFGLEQALVAREVYYNNEFLFAGWDPLNPILFPSDFTAGKAGIPINGLIWMGNVEFMREQIREKLECGFSCIKLKIGVNWEEEYKILRELRKEFTSDELELRVDANGGFNFEEAKTVLKQLAELEIHSIEQPIKANNHDEMAQLCAETPTPIALDEELIGKHFLEEKQELLEKIKPQYIILKPSLVGGFRGSKEWIDLAEKQNIAWWITSALESNLGLNAIAQWTYSLNNSMPQGLGTGSLYTNNLPSRLEVRGEKLFMNPIEV